MVSERERAPQAVPGPAARLGLRGGRRELWRRRPGTVSVTRPRDSARAYGMSCVRGSARDGAPARTRVSSHTGEPGSRAHPGRAPLALRGALLLYVLVRCAPGCRVPPRLACSRPRRRDAIDYIHRTTRDTTLSCVSDRLLRGGAAVDPLVSCQRSRQSHVRSRRDSPMSELQTRVYTRSYFTLLISSKCTAQAQARQKATLLPNIACIPYFFSRLTIATSKYSASVTFSTPSMQTPATLDLVVGGAAELLLSLSV